MKTSFIDLAQMWLNSKKISLRQGTLINYQGMLKNYIAPFFKDVYIEDIDVAILDRFKDKYESIISEKTLRNLFIIIKGTLDYAIKLNLINYNCAACIKLKKGDLKKIEVLSQKEEEELYSLAKQNYYIGIILGLKCGLRIGEVLALTWRDVDLQKKMITINKSIQRCKIDDFGQKCCYKIGETKSRSANRQIPIDDEVADIMYKYKEISIKKLSANKKLEEQFLINNKKGNFISPNTYTNKFKKVLNDNNIRQIKFHVLRHTYGTRMANKNVSPKLLSQVMGHTSVTTTQDYYVHPNNEDIRNYF